MASISESVIRSALGESSLARSLIAQEIAAARKIEQDKKALLGNPKKLDEIVAMAAAEFSPMTKQVKDFSKYTSKADAVDAAIPSDHPLKGYSHQLKTVYTQALTDPQYRGVTAGEILQGAAQSLMLTPDEKSGRPKIEAAFKYKRLRDAEFFEFDEDESYRKLPGYDLWLTSVQKAEDEELASEAWFADIDDYKSAALWGAGFGAAFGAFTSGGAAAPVTGVAGAGINMLLETVAHPLRRAVRGTEWYRSKITSDAGWEKAKALGGELGADVAMALASGTAASRLLRRGLQKAAETGRVTAESLERFHVTGRAMDAVRVGQSLREERLAQESLEKALNNLKRGDAYDATVAALDAATAPPGLKEARQGFADIVNQLRTKRVGDALTKQGELAGQGVSEQKVVEAATEAVKKGPKKPGPKKSPKKKFNELSEAGAAKALDDGAKTGKLDEAIEKVHTDEQVVKKVLKTEEVDYGKVLVGKKKAGKRIAGTDKARVVLQRAGYTPEQIAALDSKKVVRLATKVRAERTAERTAVGETVRAEALNTPAPEPEIVNAFGEAEVLGEAVRTPRAKVSLAQTAEEAVAGEEELLGRKLTNLERIKVVHGNLLMRKAAKQVEAMHTGAPGDEMAEKLAGIGDNLIPETRFPAETPPMRGQGLAVREYSNVPEADVFAWDYMVDQMENKFLKEYGRDYLKWFDWKTGLAEADDVPDDIMRVLEKEWGKLEKRFGSFKGASAKDREAMLQYAKDQGLAGLQTDEGVEKLSSFFDGKNLPQLILAGVMSIPVISLLSPSEAEAAGWDTAGKTVPRILGVMAKRASRGTVKGEIKNILKQMDDIELTSEAIKEGQKVPPRWQKQLGVDEMIIDDLGKMTKAVARTKSLPLSVDKMTDPATFSNMFYTTGYGPAVQLATAQTAWGNNSKAGLTIVNNALKDVPGYRPAAKEISEAFEPLVERYGIVQAARTIEYRIDQLERFVNRQYQIATGKKVGPKVLERAEKSIDDAQAQMEVLKNELSGLQPEVAAFNRDWEATAKAMARVHSSARMALAVEDTADFKYYPWLKGMLSYEEQNAVGHLKNLMEDYAIRHLELGHKVIEDRPFIHHAFHPKYADKLAGEVLDRVGLDLTTAIPFTKLFRRSKYSKLMVPDVGYSMQRYIPDAERRIQMTRFWYGPTGKKSAKNTWYSHSRSATVQGSEALSSFWRRLERAYKPYERTGWNVWANRYSALETFMLIGFAPATAFKHVFKNIGTWGQLGFRNAASHAPEAFSTSVRNWINSPEVQKGFVARGLQKLGLNTKAKSKFMDEYVRSYTHQWRMLNTIADLELEAPRGFGIWDNFDRALYKLNEKGSVMIRAVEAFDRAHSMTAALDMAARMNLGQRGMTAKQAAYGVFDTILKNNFLGQGLNPNWMRNPVIRAVLLFQNTPFKILERRLVNAAKAYRDVKTAAGVIKAQDIPTTLRELADLKNYIFRGESLLKQNLIADALTQSRDFFGTPFTKQFFREFMYGGMVVWGLGGIMDADFMPHTFHLPFLSTFGGDKPQLAVSPFATAGYKLLQGTLHPSDRAEQDEFWVTEFMQDWLGKKQLIPQTAFKVLRISNDDIPEVYRDSKLAYLFSVPAKHQ